MKLEIFYLILTFLFMLEIIEFIFLNFNKMTEFIFIFSFFILIYLNREKTIANFRPSYTCQMSFILRADTNIPFVSLIFFIVSCDISLFAILK